MKRKKVWLTLLTLIILGSGAFYYLQSACCWQNWAGKWDWG